MGPHAGGLACPPPAPGDNGDRDAPCRANFWHRDPAGMGRGGPPGWVIFGDRDPAHTGHVMGTGISGAGGFLGTRPPPAVDAGVPLFWVL